MLLIKPEEINEFKCELAENPRLLRLWTAMCERVEKTTEFSGIEQPFDTKEWYHIVTERLCDAAFVYAVKGGDRVGDWLRNVVNDICAKTAKEWCGPWFRTVSNPIEASLETAHIGIAIAFVYDICKELFSQNEREKILAALRENCQIPSKLFLENCRKSNNWFVVILHAYTAVSVILDDDISDILPYFEHAIGFFDKDSYGESLQYSSYAALHLCEIWEIIFRYDPNKAQHFNTSCCAKLMPWYAASMVNLCESMNGNDDIFPRALNFGDSAAVFRPSADLLLHVAARLQANFPTESGVARWIFEYTYKDEWLAVHNFGDFEFFGTFGYLTLILYAKSAPHISPFEANLPLISAFETGNIIMRDSWENTKTVLGVQGGYVSNSVTAHRHLDQNSFILAYQNERIFADPGHCCYRLASQAQSVMAQSHNTWTFSDNNGVCYTQKQVSAKDKTPLNRLIIAEKFDDIAIISCDAAGVYGDEFLQAERTWVCVSVGELYIIDRIKTKIPMQRTTHFVVNNFDGKTDVKNFPGGRVVIRRGGVGAKLIPAAENCEKFNFGWTFMHMCYHTTPLQKGQGTEGSGLVFRYSSEDFACEHTAVYAIALAEREWIHKWHVKSDKETHRILPRGDIGGSAVTLDENGGIMVKNHYNGKNYYYQNGKISPI